MVHDFDLGTTIALWCGSDDPRALFGVFIALLSVGLAGGFAHCGPMCGPFVLMQIGTEGSGGPGLRRLVTGLLPFYQLGRIATYAALGAVAGGLGASFVALSNFRGALSVLLALAAAIFLVQALKAVAPFIEARLPHLLLGTGVATLVARAAEPLLRAPGASYRGPRGILLGLVLGFLPCGFLYAALTAAMATGGALAGSLAMLAFGLGTIPALATVGVIGTGLAQRWRRFAAGALPAILLLNAATLGSLALRLAG